MLSSLSNNFGNDRVTKKSQKKNPSLSENKQKYRRVFDSDSYNKSSEGSAYKEKFDNRYKSYKNSSEIYDSYSEKADRTPESESEDSYSNFLQQRHHRLESGRGIKNFSENSKSVTKRSKSLSRSRKST